VWHDVLHVQWVRIFCDDGESSDFRGLDRNYQAASARAPRRQLPIVERHRNRHRYSRSAAFLVEKRAAAGRPCRCQQRARGARDRRRNRSELLPVHSVPKEPHPFAMLSERHYGRARAFCRWCEFSSTSARRRSAVAVRALRDGSSRIVIDEVHDRCGWPYQGCGGRRIRELTP
jgi:hypothetical protein